MSETKTIYIQSVESKSGMGKNGKPWKSYNVTATSGEKLSGFDNQWGSEEPVAGDCYEIEAEWEEQYKNWKVKKGLKVVQSDGGFFDGQPPPTSNHLPPTNSEPVPTCTITPELLAENLEWCWDAAGIILGGEEGAKQENYPTRHALTATLYIQMGRSANWKTDFEATAGGETAVEFLKTELRKNYNNSKLPPDWKERVAVAGKSTAAMELLTCLFDSTNVLIDIKREEAQENARMAAPLTDGDIPF